MKGSHATVCQQVHVLAVAEMEMPVLVSSALQCL